MTCSSVVVGAVVTASVAALRDLAPIAERQQAMLLAELGGADPSWSESPR